MTQPPPSSPPRGPSTRSWPRCSAASSRASASASRRRCASAAPRPGRPTVDGIFRDVNYLATGLATDRVPEDDIVVVAVHFTKDNGELSSVTLDEHTKIETVAQRRAARRQPAGELHRRADAAPLAFVQPPFQPRCQPPISPCILPFIVN